MLTKSESKQMDLEIDEYFSKFEWEDQIMNFEKRMKLREGLGKILHKFDIGEQPKVENKRQYYVVSMIQQNEVGGLYCLYRLFEAESSKQARLKFVEHYPPDYSSRIVRVDLFTPETEHLYEVLHEEFLVDYLDSAGDQKYAVIVEKSQKDCEKSFREKYFDYVFINAEKIRSLTEEQIKEFITKIKQK